MTTSTLGVSCRAGLVYLLLSASCSCWAIRVAPDGQRSKQHDELNLRPLVGILSQSGTPAPRGQTYIAASYVKFVEAAGARAVPIMQDMSRDEVTRR
jgi:hypothetical protein